MQSQMAIGQQFQSLEVTRKVIKFIAWGGTTYHLEALGCHKQQAFRLLRCRGSNDSLVHREGNRMHEF